MKAVVQDRYGDPGDVLSLRDVERPSPGRGEVLVRVRAASLHQGDSFMVRGVPFIARLATGLLRPKPGVPGLDLAGRVEAVGDGVTTPELGDEVFGSCEGAGGACAEFARAQADKVVAMPAGLSPEEAATVPTSGLAALHALRDAGGLQKGQRLLVNGASGGLGTFAVQLARAMGAEVTGVCSTRNLDLVRELGAAEVIDYTRDDFTDTDQGYDMILDNVENRPLAELRRALTPRGVAVLNSGTGATGLALMVRLVKPLVISPFVGHTLRRYLSVPKNEDLLTLREMLEAGEIKPALQQTVDLADVPRALEQLGEGHARGKIAVHVGA